MGREVARRRVWLIQNHHRTHRGDRIDLDGFYYLRNLYADPSPDIVMQCAAQSGKTEWGVVDGVALAENNLNVQNVQPKENLKNEFFRSRVDPLLKAVQYYRERGHIRGSLLTWGTDEFVGGTFRMTFSNTDRDFIAFPADAFQVDEIDRCDLKNLELLPDRLLGSKWGLTRRMSTPTTVGSVDTKNVNYYLERSDHKLYHVECPSCKMAQPIDWWKNVIDEKRSDDGRLISYGLRDREWNRSMLRDPEIYCRTCGHPLDRLSRGEWVATNPLGESSGYVLSKIHSPLIDMRTLWGEYDQAASSPIALQRFCNSVLGVPYSGAGDKITEEILARAANFEQFVIDAEKSETIPGAACSMGIDVGPRWLDVRASWYPEPRKTHPVWRTRQAAFIGKVKTFGEVIELIRILNVAWCCVDAEPEQRKTLEFQKLAPCTVVRVFNRELKMKEDIKFDEQKRTATADRTTIMDAVQATTASGFNWLPQNYRFLSEGQYVAEMTNPTRVLETDAKGNLRYVWTRGFDHSFFADALDLVACQLGRFGPTSEMRGRFRMVAHELPRLGASEVTDGVMGAMG